MSTYAIVSFTRLDGKTVRFEHVNVDSISSAASNPETVSVEFENDLDRIVHLPFISHWEIEYAESLASDAALAELRRKLTHEPEPLADWERELLGVHAEGEHAQWCSPCQSWTCQI